MNREETRDRVLRSTSREVLCELPTGLGKSKIALDFMNSRLNFFKKKPSILVVVPRLVLIDNWKEEFQKWNYHSFLNCTEFVTYVSFPKKSGLYDLIIFDEAHHLSSRCRENLDNYRTNYVLLLSATVGRNMKGELKEVFPNLQTHHVNARKAIEEEILPDPKVYLLPLLLDNKNITHKIVKNPDKAEEIVIPYSQRFSYTGIKNKKITIRCTQQEYYNDLSSTINWAKQKMPYSETFKNMFLRKSGDRLKWLSDQKTDIVAHILSNTLQDQRVLTFCNSIAQTEVLGKYCINSKNKSSREYLEQFNEGKINHITACNMLDEGVNLSDCRVGVYAVLNNSERMITQKLGRLLRHPNPIIIIPYFVGTRDEELVNKMMLDYNPALIETINNINQIKL